METIIRTAKKKWICFNCNDEIDVGESYHDCPSIQDYNSTKDNRKSNLKLCKSCGNQWLETSWNNFYSIPMEKKVGKLLGKNQSSKLLKEMQEEARHSSQA